MSKDCNYNRLIQSKRWQQLRRMKIKNNPLCEDCLQNGFYVAAKEVHHVIPCERAHTIAEMERLMYDYNNLRSLCHDCHAATHKGLKSNTKESVMANVKSNINRFVEKFFT